MGELSICPECKGAGLARTIYLDMVICDRCHGSGKINACRPDEKRTLRNMLDRLTRDNKKITAENKRLKAKLKRLKYKGRSNFVHENEQLLITNAEIVKRLKRIKHYYIQLLAKGDLKHCDEMLEEIETAIERAAAWNK